MKQWNRPIGLALACAALAAVGLTGCQTAAPEELPHMAATIEGAHWQNGRIKVVWKVENLSDQTITFDADQFAQLELNGVEVPNPTSEMAIEPGEEVGGWYFVPGASADQSNELTVTARCNEGTAVGMKVTVEAET